jgi:hypothetical protein
MVGRATSKLRPGWYIEYSDRCGCNQRQTEMTKNIVSYYTFDYFYKTEVLKKDAEEMEKRLQALQERMKQQLLLQDKAKTTSNGNHKWKSASKEKCSVTNYGKGVQDRYRKRVGTQAGDPVLRPTVPLPSHTSAQIQQKTDFRSNDGAT